MRINDSTKLIGKQWWAEYSKVAECKIKDAIIRNEDKEIVIDYEYENRQIQVKLNSDDGVHFIGKYGTIKKIIGSCEFTLYKNAEGYFLFGGYSSSEEGSGICWVQLTKYADKIENEYLF